MTTTAKHLVEISGVRKEYPENNGGVKHVLNGIDLNVRQGEFVTVVGPTGCGKSTLFRLLLGSEKPTVGSVRVGGEVVEEPSRDRGIVYQRYSLSPNRTALFSIMEGLLLERYNMVTRLVAPLLYRGELAKFRAEALEYLDRIGLAEEDAHKYPYQLSGGMRQRIAIAQALIMKPRVLMMDEPFGALDEATRESMQEFILEQHRNFGMTVFFVTHEISEALYLGSRVLGLSQYYDEGNGPHTNGAKIVYDAQVSDAHPKPEGFKQSERFKEMSRQLHKEVLSKGNWQKSRDFRLVHPDAIKLPAEATA